ncbi:MAG: hypothetical protein ACFHWX_22500 [Bacteroidota bacterium]
MMNTQKLISILFLVVPLFVSAQESGTAPKVVTPGVNGGPPSDAIVLFDGSSLNQFSKLDGTAADWVIKDNVLVVGKN